MSEDRHCPECGAVVNRESEFWPLCPVCMMKLAIPDSKVKAGSDPPERVGPYKLVRKLGEGGMGEVWEAEQQEPLQRKVAVKLIKIGMDTRQVIARFESERQALAMMNHPGIAAVMDAGATEQGRPYFVMENIDGAPITAYCDEHRLTTNQRLELFMRVCEGVRHAHQRGIIHRDIKPSNILVSIEDDEPVPKIIDFGVAKATEQRLAEQSFFTEFGQLLGTPEYMSPEQAATGRQDVDTRTDIYSLGMVLYELLAGALPFDPKDLRKAGFEEILRIVREEIPSKPSTRVSTLSARSVESAERRRTDSKSLVRQLSGDLDCIVMKALRKDRSERYGTVGEFLEDVKRYLRNEPVLAGPPSFIYRSKKFWARHKVGVTVAVIIGLLVVGFTVRELMAAKKIAIERDTAEQVSEFLVELFSVSHPRRAQGKEITAREVLDMGMEKIRTNLEDKPEVKSRIMMTIGTVYRNLGLYDEARSLLEEALEIDRNLHGDNHPDTLAAYQSLGWTHRIAGDLDEAEKCLQTAADGYRELLGPEARDTLQSESMLARLYRITDREEQAEELLRDVLGRCRQHLGEDDELTLNVTVNLGTLLHDTGKRDESAELFYLAYEGYRRTRGDDHPATTEARQRVARTLAGRGELDEAEKHYREILEIRRRVYGNDHTDTINSVKALAELLAMKGQFPESETLLREALAGSRRSLGDDNISTYQAAFLLCSVLSIQKKLEEAEKYCMEAVEGNRRILGDENPRTLQSIAETGKLLLQQGKFDESERMLLEANAGFRKKFGDKHNFTAITYGFLSTLAHETGRMDDAIEYTRLALEGHRHTGGEDSLNTLHQYVQLADLIRRHGDRREAVPLLEKGLEGYRRVLGDQHARTKKTAGKLFNLYNELGEEQQAADLQASFQEDKTENR